MPFERKEKCCTLTGVARVAELVYAYDSKSYVARHVGSIPTPGTAKERSDFAVPGRKRGALPCGNRNPIEHFL